MTPHSIVRSLLLLGWKVIANLKGATDVTTIGAERPDTRVEVILGVDTHLDFHVAVAVDHLGRRLGELSVPTTTKGLREAPLLGGGFRSREVRWGRRYQQLRGRAGPPPEDQGDRGAGGGAPEASAARLAPSRQVRPLRRRAGSP